MRKSIWKLMIASMAAGTLTAGPLLAQDRDRDNNRGWNFDRFERGQNQNQNQNQNQRRDVNAPSARRELETQVTEVNQAARRAEKSADLALHTASIETGVPKDRIKAMHDKYPDIGPAGVMIANVMAAETKKDPESFMREHKNGKRWAQIARENNVAVDKLTVRLERLETALQAAEDKTPARTQQQRRNRDRD